MATLNEVLRGAPLDSVVLAGAAGLGREVRRLQPLESSADLMGSVGAGDLIVYGGFAASAELTDHALAALLSTGAAGVLTDVVPGASVIKAAEASSTPLISTRGTVELGQALHELRASIDLLASLLPLQQQYIERDVLDLACSGATRVMVLERMVEKTGKTGFLQSANATIEYVQSAAQQDLARGVLQRAMREGDAATRRWMQESADPVVANVQYLELPNLGLVRLVAPIWVDGRLEAAISLLSRPAELSARDRCTLVASARAMTQTSTQARVDVPLTFPHRRRALAAMVLRAPGVGLEVIVEAIRRVVDLSRGALNVGRDDVRAWLPYESVDQWTASVDRWHGALTHDLGPLTIGHAMSRRGTDASTSHRAVVQAAEAALVGERLFGPGQVTSYADAQLAKFLLSQHGVSELRSLYERAVGKLAVEDLRQDSQLVATLEAYCETFMTRRTAERLGVHRNTVLYRLKRIEEITSVDLEDAPTRLLFQYGLLAGRMLRKAAAA